MMEGVLPFDVVILGAGAAGMMCAIQAGHRGRRVALIEHSASIGRKILISGGGRCNFTNVGTAPERYLSENPHFCTSALSRFTPEDFIGMVKEHGIRFHEKKLGQLFCDRSASEIVQMLAQECRAAGAVFLLQHETRSVHKNGLFFEIETDRGTFSANSLIIATGGLSLPKLGSSNLGYRIAKQFGIKIEPPAPALDGLVFSEEDQKKIEGLAGISIDSGVTVRNVSFRENILFTHSGLSGPAALQASLYWRPGDPVRIRLLPEMSVAQVNEWLLEKKRQGASAQIKNLLAELLPRRFCERFCELYLPNTQPLPQISQEALDGFSRRLQDWRIVPDRTVGYQRAEVTRGGVSTDDLSSKTMEAKKVPGLYFIGEVVDVTGWLGGYNFQWAWASGWASGQEA